MGASARRIMELARAWAPLWMAVAALGCSSTDVAGTHMGGAGAGPSTAETFGFDFVLYEQEGDADDLKGEPLADALVALDLPTGERADLRTDSTGKVRVEVPAGVEHFTWTVAKPGYVPVRTFYRVTVDEAREKLAEVGELFTTMAPTPEPLPDDTPTVTVTVESSTPFCGSWDWGDGCSGFSNSWQVLKSSQPTLFVVYSTDEEGCPVELREVTLPDTLTDQTIQLEFDGSNPAVAERYDVTLRLPEASDSLLRSEDIILRGRFPFWVTSPTNRIYGGACRKRHDPIAGTVDFTVAYFPKEDVFQKFEYAAFPDFTSGWGEDGTASNHMFAENPGPGVYDVLDIPVLSSPTTAPDRSSRFAWQQIPGATTFVLVVKRKGSRDDFLWTTTSWRRQEIVLPALPQGYDETVEWGGVELGLYRLYAHQDWLPELFAHPSWVFDGKPPVEYNSSTTESLPGRIVD